MARAKKIPSFLAKLTVQNDNNDWERIEKLPQLTRLSVRLVDGTQVEITASEVVVRTNAEMTVGPVQPSGYVSWTSQHLRPTALYTFKARDV